MAKTAVIIPARYGSTRLEGKPLIKVHGKPVIQWVYERAMGSKLADMIIVATDDSRIYDCVRAFGGQAEMTSPEHKCGSDRIMEVVSRHSEIAYICNLQGDEPLMTTESIDTVIRDVKENDEADISTLIRVLTSEDDINNPNIVKCVIDKNNFALYFSRSKIPYERNCHAQVFYAHLGIYGYKRSALEKMTSISQTPLEKAESLEQLRALENGMKIKTSLADFVPIGIDTKEDLEKFKKILEQKLNKI